jgi:hypothetical protein
MSGIVGIVRHEAPVDRDLLAALSRSLEFRGPHGTDMWLEGADGLGHALLRTDEHGGGIAVSGNLRIVADARLHARQELLNALGAPDASDPELILLAYRRWGKKCLDRLSGDFSFAIRNSEERTLFCARDQFGLRPLFYCALGHSPIFSNTLESVRTHPDVPRTLCDIAIADFLLFGYSADSSLTSFEAIRRLPAAHSLTWRDGSLRVEPYWRLSLPEPVRFRRVLYREKICVWDNWGPALNIGLNMAPARRMSVNNGYKAPLPASSLLAEPRILKSLDYRVVNDIGLDAEPVWSVSRNGIIHGFCLWFDSELAPGLSLSNAPGQPETIYGRIFVPLEEPVAVEAGCEIAARIRADLLAGEYVWRWDTSVNGERRFSQSTFYGMPVVPPHLHRAPARGIK